MGKKYIVEIGRLERLYKAHVSGNGKPNITWLSPEFDLTPYTEPDLEQVRCAAYEEGRNSLLIEVQKAGKNTIKLEEDEYYQRGLEDAWEAVKKLARMDTDTSESITGYFGLHNIMHNLTASEVIEKLKAYERCKEAEIQVGDEVVFGNDEDIKAVVIDEADEAGVWFLLSENGCVERMDGVLFHRTGRHFSELTEIFKKMWEE